MKLNYRSPVFQMESKFYYSNKSEKYVAMVWNIKHKTPE